MKNVAILGDPSFSETAYKLVKHLDSSLYKAYPIIINGSSLSCNGIEIDKNDFSLTINGKKILFDVVYNSWDPRRLEGYFALLGIPYANSSVWVAPIVAHKFHAEKVVTGLRLGVNTAKSITLFKNEKFDLKEIVAKFGGLPLIVKPAYGPGMSIGVNKERVDLKNELIEILGCKL